MKTSFSSGCRARKGFLQIDLLVGMAILGIAIIPLGYSFSRERQLLRNEYYHAVIVEIVDGEMEILVAGAAKDLPDGQKLLTVNSPAAAKLPAAQWQFTRTGKHLQLAWLPKEKCGLSPVIREATLP
ncbi:MAG: hypothetical protein WCS94_09920 [Verrucomicrobiota bacterium]